MANKKTQAKAATATPMSEFEGHAPLKGHKELGWAIVDKNGFPSGSPANYEVLREESLAELDRLARLEDGPTQEDIDATVEAMLADLGK